MEICVILLAGISVDEAALSSWIFFISYSDKTTRKETKGAHKWGECL